MMNWLTGGAEAIAAAPELDGAHLNPLWGLPFVGLLLSIALLPLIAPRFWEHRFDRLDEHLREIEKGTTNE